MGNKMQMVVINLQLMMQKHFATGTVVPPREGLNCETPAGKFSHQQLYIMKATEWIRMIERLIVSSIIYTHKSDSNSVLLFHGNAFFLKIMNAYAKSKCVVLRCFYII